MIGAQLVMLLTCAGFPCRVELMEARIHEQQRCGSSRSVSYPRSCDAFEARFHWSVLSITQLMGF